MKILIFSLGAKGFSVVKALCDTPSVKSIRCVIGQDPEMTNDFSNELAAYCDIHKIDYTFRKNFTYNAADYDWLLAVGWRWLIRDAPEEKIIVFHDSLLPRYRGFAPLVTALINREKMTGVTALLGANEFDKGNILLQLSMDLTYPTRIDREILRISDVYYDLAIKLFNKLNDGSINRHGSPQNESEATYSVWRDEQDYRINWDDDAQNIEHFISCVNWPYRGASTLLNGETVRIIGAQSRADIKIENRSPGKVIFNEDDFPIVICGHGLLKLTNMLSDKGDSMLPLKKFRNKFY